jgi:hypothetical protein
MWRRSKRQQQSTLGSFGVSYLKDNQGMELLAFAMKAMTSGWSAIRKCQLYLPRSGSRRLLCWSVTIPLVTVIGIMAFD